MGQKLTQLARQLRFRFLQEYALLCHKLAKMHFRFAEWRKHNSTRLVIVIWAALAALSLATVTDVQQHLGPLFTTEARLAAFTSALITLGGALVGAAAIVSSLVLFSMQVNIERMPHGLFRKLSQDPRLLAAFAGTFIFALAISGISLFVSQERIGLVTLGTVWLIGLILALFLYGYRRALLLVNPLKQLEIIVLQSERDLRMWGKRATRTGPLIAGEAPQVGEPEKHKFDTARLIFFQKNPSWTLEATKSVQYAVSFARRYAEQGDHEVSAAAINAILAINNAYISTKGRTFIASNPFADADLSTDAFINHTLECLRQTGHIAVARGDEQLTRQNLQAITRLAILYLNISYSSSRASRTHTHLATNYLTNEVQQLLPLNRPDIIMEGVRQMGTCAARLMRTEEPDSILDLVRDIGSIACTGVTRENYRPIISTGVAQLAMLSGQLLTLKEHDVGLAADAIRNAMANISRLVISLPSVGPFDHSSHYLSPFYSGALLNRLVKIANGLAEAPADDEAAKNVIWNLSNWADGTQSSAKEQMLYAIEKRSNFAFETFTWLHHMANVLISAAASPACDASLSNDLRNIAQRLLGVFTFIPTDKETLGFVGSYDIAETLYEAASFAEDNDASEVSEAVAGYLLSWAFRASTHKTGWHTLEHAIYALATLALKSPDPTFRSAVLLGNIKKKLDLGAAPDPAIRTDVAKNIRDCANTLHSGAHHTSLIEEDMLEVDHSKLEPLLRDIADLLAPLP
ncbi:hypothetical protein [Salipiger mangrovisoli]|uniref:DUF2254 domain-containing protein n=1 Tax=Salipiger mangrovisoli TaxID=2865933 RepID=A0ABR9X3Z2_9RHOB|nr:hypothetical protein [Salipiger mangrovisoli]MBE9638284.1 hypothetical protein [Salipiger mangrovisoli]